MVATKKQEQRGAHTKTGNKTLAWRFSAETNHLTLGKTVRMTSFEVKEVQI